MWWVESCDIRLAPFTPPRVNTPLLPFPGVLLFGKRVNLMGLFRSYRSRRVLYRSRLLSFSTHANAIPGRSILCISASSEGIRRVHFWHSPAGMEPRRMGARSCVCILCFVLLASLFADWARSTVPWPARDCCILASSRLSHAASPTLAPSAASVPAAARWI